MIAAHSSPRLLTAADLAVLPTALPSGDVWYELDDGVLVVRPPSDDARGRTHARILASLGIIAEERLGLGRAYGRVGVLLRRNPDRVVGPCAAFVLARSLPVRLTPEGFLDTIPDITVEITSRFGVHFDVLSRVGEYHAAGVRVVWVLDADDRTVTAYRPDRDPVVFGAADALTDELLPGFAVPVARLFVGS